MAQHLVPLLSPLLKQLWPQDSKGFCYLTLVLLSIWSIISAKRLIFQVVLLSFLSFLFSSVSYSIIFSTTLVGRGASIRLTSKMSKIFSQKKFFDLDILAPCFDFFFFFLSLLTNLCIRHKILCWSLGLNKSASFCNF